MPAFNYFTNKIRSYLEFLRDRSLIARSGLFDRAWYQSNYTDVAQMKGDAIGHYLHHEGREGRDSGPSVSSDWYLETYADVKNQSAYPTHDYIRREWGKYFDIIQIQPLGIDNHQDTILLRNKAR